VDLAARFLDHLVEAWRYEIRGTKSSFSLPERQ